MWCSGGPKHPDIGCDVQHETRQEMHKEVRATLTSVSELSLSVSRGNP
jgi:hypothetical protein